MYATLQHNLGAAYGELPTGDRTANLERAMACFAEALRFHTAEAAPLEYATLHYDMGGAYARLPTGDRTANLERAIACYAEALRFHTAEAAPFQYAMVQSNLGVAYSELPTGDRTANLERAIACYTEALRFQTAEAAPLEYAILQNNLGVAYSELPTGDRTANLERAIACFTEALRFQTAEAAPQVYASLQHSLGTACMRLLTGDRTANLERAIACFREGLRFQTAEAAPLEYASHLNNLGWAYADLPSGDRAANLQRAIACYTEALRFWTAEASPHGYATAQNNLGMAYESLPTGDRTANLERAIACFTEALRFQTAEAAPLQYAMLQSNLGAAYGELPTGNRTGNLERAIACYTEALRLQTLEAAPVDHRTAAGALARLHFDEGEWNAAHELYATAIAAGDALYEATATETGRQTELAEAGALVASNAYCLAKLGRSAEAVECLERGRARALAADLARDRAELDGASEHDQAAFEGARDRIKALEAAARSAGEGSSGERVGLTFVELAEALAAARGELSGVVERIRGYVPGCMAEGLSFPEIVRSAGDERPLVYLDCTTRGSFALIVPLDARTLGEQDVVWLNGFTSVDEAKLPWAIANLERLQKALEWALSVLGERVMGPLAERLGDLGFSEATMIPAGRLSLLPLPAAAPKGFTVALAPSARALRATRTFAERTDGLQRVLLAVGNPFRSEGRVPAGLRRRRG